MPYTSLDKGLTESCLQALKRKDAEKHAAVMKQIADGAKVEVECSAFTDPGEDYTKLMVNDECVLYSPGY